VVNVYAAKGRPEITTRCWTIRFFRRFFGRARVSSPSRCRRSLGSGRDGRFRPALVRDEQPRPSRAADQVKVCRYQTSAKFEAEIVLKDSRSDLAVCCT